MVRNERLSKYQTFLEKKKAAVNGPKIVADTMKIVKFLLHLISEYPYKGITLMLETETVGPCLVWKLKRGRGALLQWPTQWLRLCTGNIPYWLYDKLGTKPLKRLPVGFGHLLEQKSRRHFAKALNPLCACAQECQFTVIKSQFEEP